MQEDEKVAEKDAQRRERGVQARHDLNDQMADNARLRQLAAVSASRTSPCAMLGMFWMAIVRSIWLHSQQIAASINNDKLRLYSIYSICSIYEGVKHISIYILHMDAALHYLSAVPLRAMTRKAFETHKPGSGGVHAITVLFHEDASRRWCLRIKMAWHCWCSWSTRRSGMQWTPSCSASMRRMHSLQPLLM